MPNESTPVQPQRPCVHCGDCARACPVELNPQSLFFALVAEDWPAMQRGRLDACTECHRCDEVCPSHIPLLVWLRWGKTEWRRQELLRERADAARARYEARNARLQRERGPRETTPAIRHAPADDATTATTDPVAATLISKADVMEAIARSRARREAMARGNAHRARGMTTRMRHEARRHRRAVPPAARAGPGSDHRTGISARPSNCWSSVILSAQATDIGVNKATREALSRRQYAAGDPGARRGAA